jgi:hypothetical protein
MSHYGNLALVAAGTTLTLVIGVTAIAGAIDTTASCTPAHSADQAPGASPGSVICTVATPAVETITATATATVTVTSKLNATSSETLSRTSAQATAGGAPASTLSTAPNTDGLPPTTTPTGTSPDTPTDTPTGTAPAGGPFLPYTAGSYFYSAPSDYGAIDPTLTSQMRSFMSTFPDQRATPYPKLNGVGGNHWGMVYAEGSAGDPLWTLTGTLPTAVANRLSAVGFHAPAYLGDMLTGTSDSPFVVLDRASGITIWGAGASKGVGNTIRVTAAGYFQHTSNGLDTRRPESDSSLNFRSRGVIPDSMVIRKDRLDWAVANHTDLGHVLEIFWPETDSSLGSLLPMVGDEGGKSGWGAEGQRIGIDPSINLADRNCTPYARAIALTLQRHGAYLGDNSGGAAAFKMEQDTSAHPVWGASIQRSELSGCVSWPDFVAYSTPK